MKRLNLLVGLMALIFAYSCSSDDDGGSQDRIIGTWKQHQYFEDGVEVQLEDCEYEATIVFSAEGTFTSEFYDDLDMDGDCELDDSASGTWENEGGGFYTSTIEGFSSTVEVHFEGNTMYFEEEDEGVVYRDVFIKQ